VRRRRVVFREARKLDAVRVSTSTFDSTLWGFVGDFLTPRECETHCRTLTLSLTHSL